MTEEAINVTVIDRAEVRTCQVRDCDFESGRLPDSALYSYGGEWLELFVCPEHRNVLAELVPRRRTDARRVSWFACRCGQDNEAQVERALDLAHKYYRLVKTGGGAWSIRDARVNDFLYALDSFGVRSVEVASDQWGLVTSRDWSGQQVAISCDNLEDGLILTFMGWLLLSLMAAMRME